MPMTVKEMRLAAATRRAFSISSYPQATPVAINQSRLDKVNDADRQNVSGHGSSLEIVLLWTL